MTNATKKSKRLYVLFSMLSITSMILPVIYFAAKAFIESELVYEKIALSSTIIIVIIMTLVNLISRVALRSRLWILLIGLYIALHEILTIIVVIGCCQVIDELVFTPLKTRYKNKYTINREIDNRGG